MGTRDPQRQKTLLVVLVCCISAAVGFLLDESHDETLQGAMHAIEKLNSQLAQVMAENQRLTTQLAEHDQKMTSMQKDVTSMGSRVSRDFIWFDDDWILAFRATHGIGKPVYDRWINKGTHDDDPLIVAFVNYHEGHALIRSTLPCGCTTVNGSLPCDRHYRSRLLDSWPSASIDQVKLALYENGVEKEHVTFTGTGSDYMSWFSQSRIVDSTWVDLKTATNLVSFSIAGRFYINLRHGGCPSDLGWLAVKDETIDGCSWGTVQHAPAFLYSSSDHDNLWEGHGFREADVMAVFIKMRPSTNLGEQCV